MNSESRLLILFTFIFELQFKICVSVVASLAEYGLPLVALLQDRFDIAGRAGLHRPLFGGVA
jgi:hypothetical protein